MLQRLERERERLSRTAKVCEEYWRIVLEVQGLDPRTR